MKTCKFLVWGLGIQPKLPWGVKVAQLFQMWRNSVIMEELLFLVCVDCYKEFSIRRGFCQKTVSCPYCGGVARYVETPQKFLSGLCTYLLRKRKAT